MAVSTVLDRASAVASRRLTQQEEEHQRVSQAVFAPIVFSFANWVIGQALEQDFQRLYFLARDGYVVYRAAQEICRRTGVELECRYLIGSRRAWRFAACDRPDEQLFEQLFAGAGRMAPRTLLARISAPAPLRKQIYSEIGMAKGFNEDDALSKLEAVQFCRLLRGCASYRAQVERLCRSGRHNVAGYLRQEGLFDRPRAALVDTGWSGSIQRTLASIIRLEGEAVALTGFYMGLFSHPAAGENGDYQSWLFGPQASASWLAGFNNNVLECVCLSPFPMAVDYRMESDGMYTPVYDNAQEESVNFAPGAMQVDFILQTIAEWYEQGLAKRCLLTVEQARKLIWRFTRHPQPYEARALGQFVFCDDMCNNYFFPLAGSLSHHQWKSRSLPRRLWNKLARAEDKQQRELFWGFGSLALSGMDQSWRGGFYGLQMYLWEYLRQAIKKIERRGKKEKT